MKLDILAIGAHPDDVELGCGGTLAKEISLGKKVGIIDLTKGELGTRGTDITRKEEVASKLERDKFEVKLSDDERTILANLNEDPILDDDHSGDIPKGVQIYEESSDM